MPSTDRWFDMNLGFEVIGTSPAALEYRAAVSAASPAGDGRCVDISMVKDFRSRRTAVGTAVGFSVAVIVALAVVRPGPFGKLLPSDRRSNLSNAATSLIPRDFNEVTKEYGGCDSFAIHPDCVVVETVDVPHDQRKRLELLRARASLSGWTETSSEIGVGSTSLSFARSGYRAQVFIKSALATEPCTSGDHPSPECADNFEVDMD